MKTVNYEVTEILDIYFSSVENSNDLKSKCV